MFSRLKKYLKVRRFNRAKIEDLEKNLITIFHLNQLKDEHLILKDTQLAEKEQEFKNLQIQQYAILAAITLAHNGTYVLDKIFFDAVTSLEYDKLLSVENLPDGSSRLSLVDKNLQGRHSPQANSADAVPTSPTSPSSTNEELN